MKRKYFSKIKFINIFFLLFILIQSQKRLLDDSCKKENLKLEDFIIDNELQENSLNEIIKSNKNNLKNDNIYTYFDKEFQIFLFKNSKCTNQYLDEKYYLEYNITFFLHLFSIDGSTETNNNYIKLVIQTKKDFNIFYYDSDGKRLFENPDTNQKNFTIQTNIFPYFKNKLYYEEFIFFENNSINIFNNSEEFFNDICDNYITRNETLHPELRKNLFFFKYDNDTYPLLEDYDNCMITSNSTSYEKETFILEYTCKLNLTINLSKIQIYNISILSKEKKENYTGPHTLIDQGKILYCYNETYRKEALKKNGGFYISIFLLFIVFICLIVLFIQNYDVEKRTHISGPPKRKDYEEDSPAKKSKKVSFSDVQTLTDTVKSKKKKKKKKKKKIIDSNEEEDNIDDNNDLFWYSNEVKEDDNKDENNIISNTEIKIKKKKKKGKRKKGKKNQKKYIESKETKSDNEDNKGYHDGKDIYGPISKDDNNDKMNKTMSKLPNAYNQFKENSSTQIKNNLHLRRLVIITNLGKNLEESDYNFNNFQLHRMKKKNIINNINENSEPMTNYNLNSNNNNKDDNDNDNEFNNKNNNAGSLVMLNEHIINQEEAERNKILRKIIGMEDSSFLSNMKRDYLGFTDAVYFDFRSFCRIFSHFLKLKQDFINIFCCNYSFAPYSIRLIKFCFFTHFLFYLETLCIGQKYYFKKHFSEEYQNFTEKMFNLTTNNTTNTEVNSINSSFFEKIITEKEIELAKIHFLYTFKYAFPRILIPAAISLISYFFTSVLSPRRKIMRTYLDPDMKDSQKRIKYKNISKKYKILYVIFGILAFIIMVFFSYSMCNYFTIFNEAIYDIPQSFLLSGLIRFIFDILLWAILANTRKLSLESHSEDFYSFSRGICEMN